MTVFEILNKLINEATTLNNIYRESITLNNVEESANNFLKEVINER